MAINPTSTHFNWLEKMYHAQGERWAAGISFANNLQAALKELREGNAHIDGITQEEWMKLKLVKRRLPQNEWEYDGVRTLNLAVGLEKINLGRGGGARGLSNAQKKAMDDAGVISRFGNSGMRQVFNTGDQGKLEAFDDDRPLTRTPMEQLQLMSFMLIELEGGRCDRGMFEKLDDRMELVQITERGPDAVGYARAQFLLSHMDEKGEWIDRIPPAKDADNPWAEHIGEGA